MNKLLKFSIFISAIISVSSFALKCAYPEKCLKKSECIEKLKGNLPTNKIYRFCGNSGFNEICCPIPDPRTAIVFQNEPKIQEISTPSSNLPLSYSSVVTTESTTPSSQLELGKRYFPTETCGWRNATLTDKIYGGRNTKPGEFPWIVLLKIRTGESEAICGGTLINEWYVLTAAHCLYFYDQKKITVTLGAADYRGTKSCSFKENIKPKIRKASKVIIHDSYYKDRQLFGGNDIALLRMNKRVRFNDCIQPACLPFDKLGKALSRDNSFLITAGWGTKGKSEKPSEILQVADQYFVNTTDCGTRYKNQNYMNRILNSQICTLGLQNARGLKGDSGSPLLSQKFMKVGGKAGVRHILVGVLSTGPQDWNVTGAVPNVYTKVNRFLDWVVKNIEP